MSTYSREGAGGRGEYARALELALLRHEISQPLVFLSASLEQVRRGIRDAAAAGTSVASVLEYLASAESGARHALDVVRRIGVEPGSPRELVDLKEVVTSTLCMVEDALRRHASVATELSDVPRVRANRTELRQVLLNLLSNAMASVKTARGVPHRILVRVVEKAPSAVALIVEDDGGHPVIARDHLGHSRVRPAGTGASLGFSFCKRAVASWGGVFAVDSVAGKRTVVTAVLPVASD